MQRDNCISPALTVQGRPDAAAEIRGSCGFPDIEGTVRFYQTQQGVLVYADIRCLPVSGSQVFGFHIHEGESCTGSSGDSFADAGQHYDRGRHRHPCHSGDLPPLFGNEGHALMAVLTDRFCVSDIIGRTVIIHCGTDDFTSQPSGNSGEKAACGVIRRCCRT